MHFAACEETRKVAQMETLGQLHPQADASGYNPAP
jgi:hypothetical protein